MKATQTLFLIFLCAFALRALFIFETYEHIDFRTPTPGMDIDLHWEAAGCILEGTDPCFALMLPSAPFFSYYLAISRSLLGDNLVWHRLLMALFGSLTILLLALVTMRLTKSLIASCVVGILCATLPSLLYFNTMLHKVSLNLFFLCLALSLLLSIVEDGKEEKRGRYQWLTGLCLFLAAINQQSALLWFIPAIAFIHLTGRNHSHIRTTRASLWFFFTLALALLFFLPMNSTKGHQHFWPQSGIHIRIGFNPNATGFYNPLPDIPNHPLGHVFVARIQAQKELGSTLTPAEANRYHLGVAFNYIQQNPYEALKQVSRKALLFFNNAEIKGVEYLKYIQSQIWLLKLPSPGFGSIFILALLGILGLIRKKKWRSLLLLGGTLFMVMVANLLTFVTWRYRLPAIIPLAVCSGIGLDFIWVEIVRKRHRQSLYLSLAIVLLGCVTTFLPILSQETKDKFLRLATGNSQRRLTKENFQNEIALLNSKPKLLLDEEVERIFYYISIKHHSKAFRELELLGDRASASSKAKHLYQTYQLYQLWLGQTSIQSPRQPRSP
ncbi:MAG: glycosyltransferase family 39 protein, partial [Myxococcota bacterium]|nr:glycosyltransferase family 39 protein [Myxococcota bacterium]